jgi:hypothetical protein
MEVETTMVGTHPISAEHQLASLDHGDGARHGDPLRHHLNAPRGRLALGVHLGRAGNEQAVVWLVDELAELVTSGSRRPKAIAFTQVIRGFAGLVKQQQTENTRLRKENAALHDEVQTLAADLDQARNGQIGGVA